MLVFSEPDRAAGVSYARRWAMSRNPAYADFELLGGDCTNFVSQCIFAEGAPMNYAADTGWYYISMNDRAAAWTGVEYLYRFLTTNTGAGPFGERVRLSSVLPGDIIQLCLDDGCYHSLFVSAVSASDVFVCAHTNDALDRPLSSYGYVGIRPLHILGSRSFLS